MTICHSRGRARLLLTTVACALLSMADAVVGYTRAVASAA